MWYKYGASYAPTTKDSCLGHPQVRGAVKRSIKAFTEGTNVVTKHQVFLLLNFFASQFFLITLRWWERTKTQLTYTHAPIKKRRMP